MKRQITLDTETTGFNPKSGDRIVEVGLVEIIDGKRTGKVFHKVINPERGIPEEVSKIHGITDKDVIGKPKFAEIANEMIDFVSGAEVVIHNAEFDLKFLNEELVKAGKKKFLSYVTNVRCSLELSKLVFPKIKKAKNETPEEEALRKMGNSLDELCDRFNIDRSSRVYHGALLDAELLADVFSKLIEQYPIDSIMEKVEQKSWVRPDFETFEKVANKLKKSELTTSELTNHEDRINQMAEENKNVPLFKKSTNTLKM